MRIIDLLNKIANGEEVPKYIKYYDKLHQKKDIMMCCYNNIIYKLDNNIIDLTDVVEILEEENKIEKIDLGILNDQKQKNKVFKEKINLLIDEINKLKEDK